MDKKEFIEEWEKQYGRKPTIFEYNLVRRFRKDIFDTNLILI